MGDRCWPDMSSNYRLVIYVRGVEFGDGGVDLPQGQEDGVEERYARFMEICKWEINTKHHPMRNLFSRSGYCPS